MWGEDRLADQAALARMARGDDNGLAELYDRHGRMVFSLAMRVLQDRADAEDIVQEVFAQAWAQAARYQSSRGAVGAWLLMLTRSRAIDRVRARRSRPENATDQVAALEIPADETPQDLQLLTAEQVRALQAALQELSEPQRVVLELAYYEGLTHAEVAERLREPLGTVKTRIRQAVMKLREMLK